MPDSNDTRMSRIAYLEKQPKLTADDARSREVSFRVHLLDSSGKPLMPNLKGVTARSEPKQLTWRPLSDRKKDPMLRSASNARLRSKVADESDILNAYWGHRGIIEPEYSLLEPYTLLDTEVYYKQAINRRQSLAFRQGFEIVGQKDNFREYIRKRIGQISYVMKVTFETFLKDIFKQLELCSNCIVVKIRDKELSGGTKSEKNGNKEPICGYAIVPPHTIYPYLDGKGKIEKWRRFYRDGRPWRDYQPDDVIHFKWDVKPGHIFGTPRSVAVRDDIYALRRLEENVELLFIQHLFPLFHVKVGTDEYPVDMLPDGTSEIDVIRAAIMNMPKEGMFITDHRVEVDVKGAADKGLDPTSLIEHFKKRVLTGLGMSALDMGEGDTANRSTSDNLSQNLKDGVQVDLRTFGGLIVMEIFRDLFLEFPGSISVQDAVADVNLEFHEIDVDGRIKQETHAANLFNNHGLNQTEFRKRLKARPMPDKGAERDDMHFNRHQLSLEKLKHSQDKSLASHNHENNKEMAEITHKHAMKQAEKSGTGPTKKTTVKHSKSATGTVTRSKTVEEPVAGKKGAAATAATKTQPQNQHGKNLDPHKAKSSQDPDLEQTLFDELVKLRAVLVKEGRLEQDWKKESRVVVDAVLEGYDTVARAAVHNAITMDLNEDLLQAYVSAGFSMMADQQAA